MRTGCMWQGCTGSTGKGTPLTAGEDVDGVGAEDDERDHVALVQQAELQVGRQAQRAQRQRHRHACAAAVRRHLSLGFSYVF